jgi:hypothetical protein
MAANGNGNNDAKGRTWVKILLTFIGSSVLSSLVTHWYDARYRDQQYINCKPPPPIQNCKRRWML